MYKSGFIKEKEIDKISVEQINEAFEKCGNLKEVVFYFGKKYNGGSQRFVYALMEKAGIKYSDFFKKGKEYYEKNVKHCENCGKELPYEKRHNRFCSSSCAASKNNIGVRRNFNPNKPIIQTKEEKERLKLERWKNGENFLVGSCEVPVFIRRYLFSKNECKCERCGWGEINENTGNIPLQIHHIDGDCTNNKEENLQLLCPNCHSLTNTFGSLNKKSKRFHRKKNNKKFY